MILLKAWLILAAIAAAVIIGTLIAVVLTRIS
jgi:hypothetical protein